MCNMWNAISSSKLCVRCLSCHLCVQGWVNGTIFFSVKHIIVPVFVSVGFLSYFYLPKAKFLIGKVAFQASSNVRSINVLVLCREWYLYFWSVATGWFRVSKFSYFSQSTFLDLKLTIRPFKSKGWLRVWVRSKEALAVCISGTTQTTVLDLFDKGCLPPSSVTARKNTFFVQS